MTTRDAVGPVAMTTMVALTLLELHPELVTGAVAWLAAWWILREPP